MSSLDAPRIALLHTVDLTSQEIHLRATPSAERGRTVSGFATCAGAGAGLHYTTSATGGSPSGWSTATSRRRTSP